MTIYIYLGEKMVKKDIQVKFKIDNIKLVLDKLQVLNYILIGGNFETITRYDTEDDSLTNKGVFIRTKSGINEVLTIKEKTSDSKNYKYFERETSSIEVENCDVIKHIFQKIGLTKLFTMEKYRLIFKKGKSTVFVDELPFGMYCEINDSESNIDKLLKIFSVNNFCNTTYWEIYENLTGIKNPQRILFDKNHVFMLTSM